MSFTSPNIPPSSRPTVGSIRRALRAGAVTAAAAITAIAAVTALPTAAHATTGELPVNALAPQITATAEQAERAFDAFVAFGGANDFTVYEQHLAETARLAARQLGYPEHDMVEAWTTAGTRHQQAVLAAMTQIGVPYRTNTSAEGEGFDCSGLTLYAWRQAGVELDRVSTDQISAAEPVGRDGAEPGDLVHFPGHVMMYLGVGDAVVHSINSGRTVEIDTISQRRADSVRFGDPTG